MHSGDVTSVTIRPFAEGDLQWAEGLIGAQYAGRL
jgi:hypothetical protein